ncbi:hypothetical protein FHT86_003538 [Rhizobium sp. BK313]|uniref:hypothetical protein n=1 Tax=Rhizobium sp. BK313 TaxID=2587081 RepID=UPI0010611D14|nr:hypothetical protein [Rhizobium sp. BK313]MBB3455239.1 hypothetical protein [Rhizobium sp. BK313]
MPQRKKRRKTPDDEYTFLAIRVEGYEANVEAAINHDVFAPQFAWNADDDHPLLVFRTQLVIVGVATYPEKRGGDTYELTFYANNMSSDDIHATLKDVQARDEHGSPKYRSYRGRQIPIYNAPKGMGLIDKVRGEPRWSAWLRVSPCFVSDALTLLGNGRRLFLAMHERKSDRTRWIQSVSLQTTDPAAE